MGLMSIKRARFEGFSRRASRLQRDRNIRVRGQIAANAFIGEALVQD
jgi:hypothetical protein